MEVRFELRSVCLPDLTLPYHILRSRFGSRGNCGGCVKELLMGLPGSWGLASQRWPSLSSLEGRLPSGGHAPQGSCGLPWPSPALSPRCIPKCLAPSLHVFIHIHTRFVVLHPKTFWKTFGLQPWTFCVRQLAGTWAITSRAPINSQAGFNRGTWSHFYWWYNWWNCWVAWELYPAFWGTARLSEVCVPFYIASSGRREFQVSSSTEDYILSLKCICPGRGETLCHYGFDLQFPNGQGAEQLNLGFYCSFSSMCLWKSFSHLELVSLSLSLSY